jgi:iron complex outermembrane receptor protein
MKYKPKWERNMRSNANARKFGCMNTFLRILNQVNMRLPCQVIGVVLAIAATSNCNIAYAQQDEAAGEIEEVVVTAQYREERIQDIAISIDAFSGEDLLERRIRKPKDLASLITGLYMNESATNQVDPLFTLRGIGTNDRNSNQNNAIAMYVDGVAVPYNAMASHALFDIKRVEVLKGPQGTLYGRNTTGGAVNFISRRPDTESGGYFYASYGERNTVDLEGAFNLPLGDSFALRLAASVSQQNGWQTIDLSNFALPNDPTFAGEALVQRNGDVDREAYRISSLWRPTEQFQMVTSVDVGKDNSQVLAMKHTGNQKVDDPGALCIFATAGIRDETQCASFAYDSRTATLIPVNVAGYNLFIQDPNDRGQLVTVQDPFNDPRRTIKSFGGLGNRIDSRSVGVTNTIDVNFSRATLTSVSGYRDFDRTTGIGQQGGPFRTIGGIDSQDIQVYTQEFRITSDDSWDKTKWVIGAFYSEDDVSNFLMANLAEHQVFSGIFVSEFSQKTKAKAIFGQIDYSITDAVQLIGGLRFTDESRTFKYGGETFSLAGPPVVPNFEDKVSDNELTWKVGANFKPADDVLLYASVATGFRGQGFPGSIAFSQNQLLPFESETITAYEAGVKLTLLNGHLQLNGAAYWYDWKDFQAASGVDRAGIRLIVLTNAGDARVKGAEISALYLPTEELTFRIGTNFLDTEVRSGELKGNELPRAPDIMLNGFARYQSTKSYGPFQPFVQVDYLYNDDIQFEIPNKLGSTEKAYWLFNARAGIRLADSGWEFSVWVENLTDKTYRTEVFGPGSLFLPAGILYGPPRTVGLSATMQF